MQTTAATPAPLNLLPTSPPPPQTLTQRLRLRPLAGGDVDALFALDADAEVRRHVDRPDAPTRAEVEARLPRLLARFGPTDEPAFWAAETTEDGRFVGWFHLRPVPEHPKWLGLGYRLRSEAWGRGYATDGASALVKRAAELGAARVVAHALEANAGSRRVLEKVGLRSHGSYLHQDDQSREGSYRAHGVLVLADALAPGPIRATVQR